MLESRYSGGEDYFSGGGTLYNKRIWETNFIPNAPDMALYGWKERGAGGVNAMLEMAKNSINSHISEFPLGTYKKAHKHGPGAHLILLSGDAGYSLLWQNDDRSDMRRADWRAGAMVIVPGAGTVHQHFNSGTRRARYLALKAGSHGLVHPYGGSYGTGSKSMKDGGSQIEYEDEDPLIHQWFVETLTKAGAKSRMAEFMPQLAGRG